MRNLILISVLVLSFLSCKNRISELSSTDPETQARIKVTGEKESSVEPYEVNILVEYNGHKESVATEIYTGSLDSSNVNFDWKEPGVCLITFSQQDNSKRKILAVAFKEKIGLKEIGLE